MSNSSQSTPSLAFIAIIEAGKLERQALLLIQSIRKFGGVFSNCEIWAVCPRAGNPLDPNVVRELGELDVKVLFAHLNVRNDDSELRHPKLKGLLNKTYAAAFLEEQLESRVQTLVMMDSDTLIVDEPKELELSAGQSVAVRPVDRVNVGSPYDEAASLFWREMYKASNADADAIWSVMPTIEKTRIRAYFNSGVVAVNPQKAIFRKWRKTVDAFWPNVTNEEVCPTAPHVFYVEQTALSATILANLPESEVKILPSNYNYPLHKQSQIPNETRLTSMQDMAIVHYHAAFSNLSWKNGLTIPDPLDRLLMKHVPFKSGRSVMKRIKDKFAKAIKSIPGLSN